MKKKLFTIFMLFIATRVPGYAAVFDLSAEAGPEYYSGYTQYQIGGMVADSDGNSGVMPFPLSQLKFPLNAFMVSGDFKLGINDFFIFHSNIKTNIFGDAIHAGKMEDSDWDIGAPDNPNRLDIFSTSDATLDAFIINTDMLIKPISVNFFSLFTGVGFLYQEFDYEIRNTSQSNYYLNESIFIPGKTLTYDVKYYIPYLEVMPVIHINDMVTISANLGFSLLQQHRIQMII